MSEKLLRCPKCGTLTSVSAGTCSGCGLRMVRKKRPAEAEPPPAEPVEESVAIQVSGDVTGVMPKLHFDGGGEDGTGSPAESSPGEAEESQPPVPEESAEEKVEQGGMASVLMRTAHEESGEEEPESVGEAGLDWLMGTQDHDTGESEGSLMPTLSADGTQPGDIPDAGAGDVDLGKMFAGDGDIEDGYGDGGNLALAVAGVPSAETLGTGAGLEMPELDTVADKRETGKKLRGMSDSELAVAYRKQVAKRRILTRMVPLMIVALGIWIAGAFFVVPYLLVEGEWSGRIYDVGEFLYSREVGLTLKLERKGRRITGSYSLSYPKGKNGAPALDRTPEIIRQVFKGNEGQVVGEFDTGKARFKLYEDDPDMAIEFHGEIRRDGKLIMFLKSEAFNTKDSHPATVELRRSSYR